MEEDELGISKGSEQLCQKLLKKKQNIPTKTIFNHGVFEKHSKRLEQVSKNEARIVRDYTPFIMPTAEHLAVLGNEKLKVVVESVNEGWNNSAPVTKSRPQPDHAAGLAQSAFSEEQYAKLARFVGELASESRFMGTFYMHFPFFTGEVKCGDIGLDIADRQNAHSMTLAVRGIVNLYQLVDRQKELHREILAFSVSHDDESVRIYGHYPVIEGEKVTFWRHCLRRFYFTEKDERWSSYIFVRNLYDVFVPIHLQRILSAIDAMPANLGHELYERFGAQVSTGSSLSQATGSQDSTRRLEEQYGQSSTDFQMATPDTQEGDDPLSKRKKSGNPSQSQH